MTPGEARTLLTGPVEFTSVGYGSSCTRCGAVVLVPDQDTHRRIHEAWAALAVALGGSGR